MSRMTESYVIVVLMRWMGKRIEVLTTRDEKGGGDSSLPSSRARVPLQASSLSLFCYLTSVVWALEKKCGLDVDLYLSLIHI